MICVTRLPGLRLAQAFVDYMVTQGVSLKPEIQPQGVALWLENETQLAQVELELQRFLQQPGHLRYRAASWRTGTVDNNWRYTGFGYPDRFIRQAGLLVITLTFLCVLVYVLQGIMGTSQVMSYLAWPDNRTAYFQFWRYFTPVLLHFSLVHLVLNLAWWWYLGSQVEKQLGADKLVQIGLLSALAGNWLQSLFSGMYFGGLSGVVYALTAYVWWCGERAPQLKVSVPRGFMVFCVLWLLVGYFDWFGFSIANGAHIAGLTIGLLMALRDFRRS